MSRKGRPLITTIITKKRRAFEFPEELRAPAPLSVLWSPDDKLICPIGRTEVFAYVPQIERRGGGILLPAGEVHLRYGDDRFGFRHTWKEHHRGTKDHDRAMVEVRKSVAEVLRPGTNIFYDFGQDQAKRQANQRGKEKTKAYVIKNGPKMAVLELRLDDVPCYSVVTCYELQNTKGTLVGALVR